MTEQLARRMGMLIKQQIETFELLAAEDCSGFEDRVVRGRMSAVPWASS